MAEYSNNYNLSNELLSFKKSIASNNREAIQKYLTQIKNLSEDFLNQALFWCIQNFKVQTDECLHLLIRYTGQNGKSKANLNCQINLQTPLIAACKKGQLSLVKRLVENGAKPDFTNSENKHPLQFILTSREQNFDVADFLISQMQSVNFLINNKYPIQIAVQREFHRIFKSLLEKGSETIFQDGNLLHFIMKQKFRKINKKKKILKQMTNKYALFTQLDKNGKTPIQYEENQQIKAYYSQNFKIKKVPQALLNSVQKISNNSSIFINLKPSKKDNRSIINQKKKNTTENGQTTNKQVKQVNKQTKAIGKQTKDEDVSFQEDVQQKQESQNNEEDDKHLQKQNKSSYQSTILKDGKKSVNYVPKSNQNSSFTMFNTTTIISSKQQGNLSSKLKSKYSGIGPKTETFLKNYPTSSKKPIDNSSKNQTKKTSGGNNTSFGHTNKDSSNIKKKKSSFQDEKKEMGSNKKIIIPDTKTSTNKQAKKQKNQRQIENQKQQRIYSEVKQSTPLQEEQSPSSNDQNKISPNNDLNEIKQVDELNKIQAQESAQKVDSNQEIQSIRQSGQIAILETEKLSQWEIMLQTCEKLMEQFIIKEESEITHLNELKLKLDEIFCKYECQSQNSINFQDSQKLKQIKVSHNHSSQNIKNTNSAGNQRKISKNLKEPSKQNLTFANKLSEEILSIQMNCQNMGKMKSDCIFEAIQMISKKVHSVLQSSRKQKIQVSIQTYGSRANGLQIQTSDIDLLIVCNINSGVKDLMLQLEKSGVFNCSQIIEVKFLANTSMPIMKLCLNSTFMHMNIDLTFQVRGHTGLRCTSLIKQFIMAQDLLKPLVVTLKTLLGHYDLCDTYTGGVGSYSLTLMTIALLQFTEIKKTRQNLGEIFLQFLLFYGFQMDYVCQAIIIHPPGFNERPAFSIYQLPYSLDLTPKLIIYDPLNPVNNVGRATYRIVQLKKLFKIWYVKLRTQLYGAKDGIQRLMSMKEQLLLRTNTI